MQIYNYDEFTKEFLNSTEAEANPEESKIQGHFVPLLPAYSTLLEPPKYSENEVPVFENKQWNIYPDYRKNFYKVTNELQVFEIDTIGEQSADFIVVDKQLGEKIKTNPENYKIENGKILEKTEEEKAQEERNRLDQLHLTKREVFLGLRKARNVMPEQIRAQITDPDAQIEFDYATEYYRGNPLIDLVGQQLGITSTQLDKFFETNDYLYLTDCTLTINPTPVEAIVKINDVEQSSIKVPYETEVKYSVEAQGYETVEDKLVISEDTTLDIALKVMPVEVPTEKVPKTSKKTKKA